MEAHGLTSGVLAYPAEGAAKRSPSNSVIGSPNSPGKSPATSDDEAPVTKMQPRCTCTDGCNRCLTEETGGIYYVKSGVSFDKPRLCRFP